VATGIARRATVGILAVALAIGLVADRSGRPTSAGTTVAKAPVGPNPVAVALAPEAGRVFVLSRGAVDATDNPLGPGTVSVLDAATGAVVGVVDVGIDPFAVAVDERAGRVFVVNRNPSGTVGVLDARDGHLLQTVHVGSWPQAVAVDEGAGRVLIANRGSTPRPGSVTVLDAYHGTVLGEIEVGAYPAAIAMDSRLGLAFVANFLGNTVSVLSTRDLRIVRTVRLGTEPGTVARLVVDESSGHLIAMSYPPRVTGGGPTDGQVAIIDERNGAILKTVTLPNPTAMAENPRTGPILVSSATDQGGLLTALDGRTEDRLWTTRVGADPDAIGVDAAADRLFVLGRDSGTLDVLDGHGGQPRCSLRLGDRAVALALSEKLHRAFVASAGESALTIVRTVC
jgi:DNA-binding beta-propeller fold protein YncE